MTEDIHNVVYIWGNTAEDKNDGCGAEMVQWTSPKIPRQILESVAEEGVLELARKHRGLGSPQGDRIQMVQFVVGKTQWNLAAFDLQSQLSYGATPELIRFARFCRKVEQTANQQAARREQVTVAVQVDPHRSKLHEVAHTMSALAPRFYLTRWLVAASILVFAAMAVEGMNIMAPEGKMLIDWGSNFGPYTLGGQWYRLLTCMFLHGGIIHLGFNMWVLSNVGRTMEQFCGNLGFLAVYLVSGLFGSLASVAWNPMVHSVGASGAIFGVFGGLMGFIVVRREPHLMQAMQPLKSSGVAFLGYNLLFGLMIPRIDMAAHAGGLAAGFLCGLVLSRPLTMEAAGQRWWRNTLVFVAGAGAVAAAIAVMPKDVARAYHAIEQFEQMVQTAFENYEQAREQREKDEISDRDFARAIEEHVLTPWNDSHRALSEARNLRLPETTKQRLATWQKYSSTQRQSFEAIVAGIHTKNNEEFERAEKKAARARELRQELDKRGEL